MSNAAFRSTLQTPHLDRLTEFDPAISTAEAQSLVVLGAQHLTDRRALAPLPRYMRTGVTTAPRLLTKECAKEPGRRPYELKRLIAGKEPSRRTAWPRDTPLDVDQPVIDVFAHM